VGLTNVLYSIYVSTYIYLDGSVVNLMICEFDDVGFPWEFESWL